VTGGRQKTVIVGAGLCGLSTGERLADAGYEVTLLERRDRVAGLARSFNDDGFIFDVGPHYFFLNVRPDVGDYARSMVKGPFDELDFRISTHFRGREIAWPPTVASMFKLPPRAMWHYFKKLVKGQHPSDIDFQGFTTFLYGQSMYDLFFGPYIRKKLPVVNGDDLHRDWWVLARRTIRNELDLGQDRLAQEIKKQRAEKKPPSTIIKALNTIYKFWLQVRSKNLPRVLYPHGGIGMIGEGICESFQAKGGTLHTNSGLTKLTRGADGRITRVEWGSGAVDDPDHVVWTGSIHELANCLEFPRAEVDYLSIALIYVTTKKPLKGANFFYTYYGEDDLIFNRLYFPTRACATLAPPGHDAVCAEYSPPQGLENIDRKDLEKRVVDGLVKLKHLKREDVLSVKVRVAKDAYPVYPLDYMERLGVLWEKLRTVPNLTAVGRTGQFYYNNMALTVCLGLDLARDLLGQPSFWQERAAAAAQAEDVPPALVRDH